MQPLADDRHRHVEPLPALGVDADLPVVMTLLGELQAQDAAVCTHGEVIGQVLAHLVMDGLAVHQPLVWAKGSTWLLDGANGRPGLGRYLPPLPLADALTSSSPQPTHIGGRFGGTAP